MTLNIAVSILTFAIYLKKKAISSDITINKTVTIMIVNQLLLISPITLLVKVEPISIPKKIKPI